MNTTNKTVENSIDEITANIGNYIVLGGMGIMNGLNHVCKYSAHKILGLDSSHNLQLKQYRARVTSILPAYNFNQEFKIISKKEFANLPDYA